MVAHPDWIRTSDLIVSNEVTETYATDLAEGGAERE
ncbi:MAG: hypothetical protein RLZZ403_471 [Pseudomonadota bacterium]|jgi:hypothetical protein